MEVGYSITGTGWLDTQYTRDINSLCLSVNILYKHRGHARQCGRESEVGWPLFFVSLLPLSPPPSLPPGTHTGTEHPQKHYTCLLFLPTRFLQRVCRCARYRLIWRWCHRADSEYQVSAANRDASVNFTPTDFEAGMLNGALTENNHPCCVGRSGILCCDYMS